MKKGIILALVMLGLLAAGPALVTAGESGLPPAQAPLRLLGSILNLAGTDPHAPYVNTTDKCSICHTLHTAGYGGLLNQPNDEPSQDRICTQCHGPGGGAAEVSTHSNKDYSGAEEAPFYALCTDCHSPHRSSNKNLVKISVTVTRSPEMTATVNFTGTMGADSFDDGYNEGQHDSICVVCHDKTAHNNRRSTELVNQGHAPVGGNCLTCHPHGTSAARRTGFMPADGNCVACHNTAQGARRQIVDSAGNGAGAGGDFKRTSHHVQPANGTVKNSDCVVCHDTSQHRGRAVRLRDPDNPNTIIAFSSGASLEPFCLNCHDPNGANGITTPFSDGKTPPNIKGNNAWANSAHKMAAGKTCFDCHNNSHGSNLTDMLSPYEGTPGPYNTNEEEGFCYKCHTGGGGASDIRNEFARTSHHQVSGSDQSISGAKVECANCHNPHTSTSTQPLIDPISPSVLWSGDDEGFCLRCHGGSAPPGVRFPSTSAGTGWDKSAFAGSSHETSITGKKCQACHEPHGSNGYSLLKGAYTKADNTVYRYQDGNYGLCFSCHIEARVVVSGTENRAARNAFGERHKTHVQDERSPCIHCHDAHASSDAVEPGLINFKYGVSKLDVNLTVPSGTHNLSTSFNALRGGVAGSCSLRCHASPLESEVHDPEDYTRSPARTTDPTFRLVSIPAIASTATPAATPVPAATPTATPTPSPTPTATPTKGITPTATPIANITSTATPSSGRLAPALTISPTPLSKPTIASTATPSSAPVSVPSRTNSLTVAATPARDRQ